MLILDDYNYFKGQSVEFIENVPYIIVIGPLGIGKSSYCKIMSSYDGEIQYFSVQRLDDLRSPYWVIPKDFIKNAAKIISIQEVQL